MEKNTIFVLLASYRDPECEKTINEIFSKAANPENIFIGICWQYSEEDDFRCFDPENRLAEHIKIKEIPFQDTKGVCWARKIAHTFYNREEYILIIDSHMLFEQNWDTYLIEQLQKCPSSKSLLSHYPAGYELPEKKSDTPPVINAAHSRTNRFESGCFLSNYNVRGNMFLFDDSYEIDTPIRCFFYAAGFVFGPSRFLEEVPYDPCLDWEEEEIAISLKLWTHGWDIFAPHKHHIYHLYHTEKIPSTPDFRKAISKDALEKRALLSKKRFYHLLGVQYTDDKEALQDITTYSLGSNRSIVDFEMAAGVNLKYSITTERSIDCWFALDNLNHPLRNQARSLQKQFTQKYDSNRKKGGETVSGDGATLQATEILRQNIITLIKNHQIKIILDLGCGDFNWFKNVAEQLELTAYLGVDIVKGLVKENNKKYSDEICSFEHADITSPSLLKADIVLVRDVLTHFKVNNVIKTLVNIKNSNSTYFLASHYPRCDRNRDLRKDGGWHKINLQIPPYTLPAPLEIIDDIPEKGKYLALWRTADIPDFTNVSMNLEWLGEKSGSFIIKHHLSKDECEHLASLKHYRFLQGNKIVLDSDIYDPVIQKIFKRTKIFVATEQGHKAIILEPNKAGLASLSPFQVLSGRDRLFLTLLYCDNKYIEIVADHILSPIRLAQGQSIVLRNCSWKIKDQHPLQSGHPDMRLLIQHFSSLFHEAETSPMESGPDDIIFNSVGDFMLARDMHKYYPQTDVRDILNSTYEILASGDVNLCNLETVVSNKGAMHPKGERNPYYYRASTILAPLLSDAHFNVVTTGNNHSMDFGGTALEFQKKYLESVHIAHCGSGNTIAGAEQPVFLSIKETIICIISFCCVRPKTIGATASSPGVFFIENPSEIANTLTPIIEDAREKAHLVIASPHWIENWEETSNNVIREEARKLLDLGCDAILGHSSHLLHGVEVYDNKPIVYDMGCFLLDRTQGHKNLKRSALFQLVIKKKRITDLLIFPLTLQNGSVDLAVGEESQIIFRKLTSLDESLETGSVIKHNHLHLSFKKSPEPPVLLKTTALFSLGEKNNFSKLTDVSTDLAMDTNPSWHPDFSVTKFQDFSLIDAILPESFRIGTGFALKVALRGEIKAEDYEVVIRGISHKFNNSFEEVHLLSDGVPHSKLTGNSEFLLDYHFVRLSAATRPGVYDIFWSLRHRQSQNYFTTDKFQDAVILGSIHAMPDYLPLKASGVDWNGDLPENLRVKFAAEFSDAPEFGTLTFIFNRLGGKQSDDFEFSPYAYEQKYNILPNNQYVYLLFFYKKQFIRWGCTRKTLYMALLRNIDKICSNRRYKTILQNHPDDLVVKLEIITGEQLLNRKQSGDFNMKCKGLKLEKDNRSHVLLPSEAYERKLFSFLSQCEYIARLHQIESPEQYSASVIESIGHTLYRGKVYGYYEKYSDME